ncbi:hypothetical protein VNI00_003747 [Paramarasmius palmivorus]|uniref:F-box domain-containing protein n=1 Tax=Paramarasmius palmivorus TaxID=297713 RepID=A0AAW0DRY3_9AGAR
MTKQKTRSSAPKDRRPRSKVPKSTKSRRIKGFRLLELPEDVGYEIFRYLSPKDLLSLSDVNTHIRSKLLDSKINFVWRFAREVHHEDAPAPMEGISESRGVKCDDIASTYPDLDCSVLELVPKMLGAPTYNAMEFYPRQELEKVIAALRSCNSPDETNTYIELRKEFLLRVREVQMAIWDWLKREDQRRSSMNMTLRTERLAAVKRRLIDLGYSHGDYWEALRLPCVKRAAPLTDRAWAMMKNQVIDTVNRRILSRQQDMLKARNAMVSRAYLDFKRSVPGSTWRTFPSTHLISLLKPVYHIKVSQDTNITEEDFKIAMDNDLCTHIERWTKKQRKSLFERYSFCAGPDRWRNFRIYNEDARSPTNEEVPDFILDDLFNMDLAIIEIRCRPCKRVSCGMSAAIRHLHSDSCTDWKPRELEAPKKNFEDIYLSNAAALCIACEGLAPWSATVDDMDQINSVYECEQCLFRGTWRSWVAHARSPPHGRYDELKARKVAGYFGLLTEDAWSCNHCHEHIDELVPRETVLQHLLVRHGIADPAIPADFFYGGE